MKDRAANCSVNSLLTVTLVAKYQFVSKFQGRWIYFGQNYLDMLRWEKRLGADNRISYAHLIPSTFIRYRKPFIEWSSSLGRPYGDSLDWWMTPLAARNTSQTPIFLHICYIDILMRQVLPDIEGELLIVCEDWFLLRTLELNLKGAGCIIRGLWQRWHQLPLGYLKEFFMGLLRWTRSLVLCLYSVAAAGVSRRYAKGQDTPLGKRCALIHTCVDDACFGPNGEFLDRYFGGLSQWLTSRGYYVTTIPWLFNTRRSVYAAFRWFRENGDSFLIIEDYVRLIDFPHCVLQILRSGLVCRGPQNFGEYAITPLFVRERIRNASSAQNIKFLLYIPAVERWKQADNRCDVYIDMFENMAPERPPIKAMNRSFPGATTIGYQHSPPPLDLIGYAMTREEWSTGIFPKQIVSHGSASFDFLEREGFPPAQLMVGPALRFSYLVDGCCAEAQPVSIPRSSLSVLVLLTLDPSLTAETLRAVLGIRDVFADLRLEVAVKVHPMMPRPQLMAIMDEKDLPRGWRWVEGDMHTCLRASCLVIGLGTGALMEAVAYGLPVICLGRELDFAYNPLEPKAETYEICGVIPPSILGNRVKVILNEKDPAVKFKLPQLSAEIISGLGKLDDAHFFAFVYE